MAAVGGVYDFSLAEGNTAAQDGEALVVVYTLPALGVSTVGILDGWASVLGDSATMNFAAPLDPNEPDFVADMRLGIDFSCCPPEVRHDGERNVDHRERGEQRRQYRATFAATAA